MDNGLAATIAGAVLAALGFVTKQFLDLFASYSAAKRSRRGRLLELYALLRAGRVVFEIQNQHARDLLGLIAQNHPGEVSDTAGFEETFSTLFAKFTPEEKKRHALLRGQTMNAVLFINRALTKWLAADDYHKTFVSNPISPRDKSRKRLASLLAKLEVHLLLWNAKYAIWIPDHPEHALVYLADEKRHGVGFPKGLAELVAELVGAQSHEITGT